MICSAFTYMSLYSTESFEITLKTGTFDPKLVKFHKDPFIIMGPSVYRYKLGPYITVSF